MAKDITLDLCQFLLSVSLALDAVEQEVLGAAQNHCRRVAYLSVEMGRRLGLSTQKLIDLTACACLHDNALTEYITRQRREGNQAAIGEIRDDLEFHCTIGEQNMAVFPFAGEVKNVVLYHHENMDGSGMFGIRGENTPLMARILHLADQVDVRFRLSSLTPEKRSLIQQHLEENADTLYDSALIPPFMDLLSHEGTSMALRDETIAASMQAVIPPYPVDFTYEELTAVSSLLAHIIDYKSPFTLRHSSGIADKTARMAAFYDLDRDTAQQVTIAAFLHDIGKLSVPDSLLEKPGKLTPTEYALVKNHAQRTYEILSVVDSFENIARWASSHHERLDGSGYFRGSPGGEQDFCSRLLSCIDIYQALVEDRPYRLGMPQDEALALLRGQVKTGKLDGHIVEDIAVALSST